ncbi:MAG TPA: hypothetical protein VNC85_04840 [Mycobacteriales bacterium]|nr:hypothetical protein [Mycobacteriales bacterium]
MPDEQRDGGEHGHGLGGDTDDLEGVPDGLVQVREGAEGADVDVPSRDDGGEGSGGDGERDDHGPGLGDHEDEDAGDGGEPRSTEEEVLDAEELATAVLPGQVHVHGRVPGETGRHDTSQNPPADVRGL